MNRSTAQKFVGKEVKVWTVDGWYLADLTGILDDTVKHRVWRGVVRIKGLVCLPSNWPLKPGEVKIVAASAIYKPDYSIARKQHL